GASHGFREACGVGVPPEGFAGRGMVAIHHFVGAKLLLREQAVAYHGERRPTRSDEATPDFTWRVLLPIRADPNPRPAAVAVRPTKLRPVAGLERQHLGNLQFGR